MAPVEIRPDRGRQPRWAMTTRLTVFYALSIFVLLSVTSAFLYWGLRHNMRQAEEEFLGHKMQVLTVLLAKEPPDRTGVNQEVLEEAEISGRSLSPFFLRVLDQDHHVIDETPGMATDLPVTAFPESRSSEPHNRRYTSARGLEFLLASVAVRADRPGSTTWYVQAASNITSQEVLLAGYRHDIGIVLIGGLLVATLVSGWITRRGLMPLEEITRATERIGAQQLQERIQSGAWPQELDVLATAFDQMLDRLQDAFERLSQFSADLAHELRTPINNLMGEAQVTLSRSRTTEEYVRVLQSSLEEYNRLARMIDNILFLAHADAAQSGVNSVPLDVRAEMHAVAEFYQAVAEEEGVELVCEGQGTLTADAMLLRRALSNLLSNALKYTPRGGRVTLRAEARSDGGLTLSVIDTGIGVASEHLPKLGNRFYRVDPSRTNNPGGAGLGLAIVKSVVALHGGKLHIESLPGAGTVASLWFAPEGAAKQPA